MRAATPGSASWAGVCYAVDEGIAVKAERRRGSVSFSRVALDRIPAAADWPRRTALAACLPQSRGFARWVTAPLGSARKARRVLPSILDVQLPFALEDCVFDVVDLRPAAGAGGTRGLAVGARAEEVERQLAALRTGGLDVHVLDHEGLALWTQALDEAPAEKGGPEERLRAVIYASDTRVTLAVGKGREFLGAHAAGRLDGESVNRVLASYGVSAGMAVEWIVAGPVAAVSASAPDLSEFLGRNWPGPVRLANEPDAFLARAVAARALTAGPLRWNFRRGRFTHPAIRVRDERRPYLLAAGLLAASVLLCVCSLGVRAVMSARYSALQSEARTRAVRIAGSPRLVPPQQDLLAARRAMEARTKLMEPFELAGSPVLLDSLRRLMAIGREEGLAFDTVTVSPRTATARGTAAKWRQCENAARRMVRQGWTPKLERNGESGETQVRFTITIGLTP